MENLIFLMIGIAVGYLINTIVTSLKHSKKQSLRESYYDIQERLEFNEIDTHEYIEQVRYSFGIPFPEKYESSFFGRKFENNESHESYLRNLDQYKSFINKTPNSFLEFHLLNAIRKEQYELAEHIKNVAKKRNFTLK